MTDHSPDHAERAAIDLKIEQWREVAALEDRNMRTSGSVIRLWAEETASLIAALRGRDRVVEDLTTALHDAISRPAGVVPASAEPFYDWRRYDRAALHDAKVMREIAA